MTILNHLNPNLKKELIKIREFLTLYTKRAYIVGGAVRDSFLGREIKDLDIEVYDISKDDFSLLMERLGAKGVGKSFFVYKFGDIDISLPRIESKVGIGHKAFDVEICNDEKEASKRRDFTMNAMMLNLFSNELLDFWDGLESIKSKEIRVIDEKSFVEDSLRVLRALQFSSRFGFKIEKKSLSIMMNIELNDLSKSRIFWEFEKLFHSRYPYFGLFYIKKLNIFEKLFTCKPKKEEFLKVALEFERGYKNFQKELYPYYFLYIWSGFEEFSSLHFLKDIQAPKEYERVFKNQPFFKDEIDDKELKRVAFEIPIKKWLGNYKKGIKQRAKELGIWDECFSGGVKIAEVIEDGFEKDEIKKEYKRRVLEKI